MDEEIQHSATPAADRSLARFLSSMVLSVSGWRALFAADEHSPEPTVSHEGFAITAVAAYLFAADLAAQAGRAVTIVVGRDTRPTGAMLIQAVIRGLLAQGAEVRALDIVASPEIMAYCKLDASIDGFFYVTASHNPIGHNGFKFGHADGAVLERERAQTLISRFRRTIAEIAEEADRRALRILESAQAISAKRVGNLLAETAWGVKARAAYRTLALSVAAGLPQVDPEAAEALAERLSHALRANPIGIVGELNGSARSASIERSLLPELGARLALYNDLPGAIVHQILPEGEGLNEAARLLESHAQQDSSFVLAYVPDNDGDRGNLVFALEGSSRVLAAQEVFALVVYAVLATQSSAAGGEATTIVCNGPTSLRVERIAEQFGAVVRRVEVGEANVVAAAAELRRSGVVVPILGEGSNGGAIAPPSTVRDPLSTILILLRMLVSTEERTAPADRIGTVLATLPVFSTLDTDDPRAKVDIRGVSHALLKRAYERRIDESLKPIVDAMVERGWQTPTLSIENFEGTDLRPGPGNRTGSESGGLRVVFSDAAGVARAAVWMRGSGTEPLFRVLADCEGEDRALLDLMVTTQRQAVERAVEEVLATSSE